jgi:hypothetical protein
LKTATLLVLLLVTTLYFVNTWMFTSPFVAHHLNGQVPHPLHSGCPALHAPRPRGPVPVPGLRQVRGAAVPGEGGAGKLQGEGRPGVMSQAGHVTTRATSCGVVLLHCHGLRNLARNGTGS